MGCSRSSWVNAIMALLIMPTWGPFPWDTTTSQPSSIKSTIALAVIFTAAICSGRVFPRAFPPSAMTTLFFFDIIFAFLSVRILECNDFQFGTADLRPICCADYPLLRSSCLRFMGVPPNSNMKNQPLASKLAQSVFHIAAVPDDYLNTLGVPFSSSFLRMSAGSANFARKIIAAMMYGLKLASLYSGSL